MFRFAGLWSRAEILLMSSKPYLKYGSSDKDMRGNHRSLTSRLRIEEYILILIGTTTMSADPSYTVLVRLPFPRGDFVDPPPVR